MKVGKRIRLRRKRIAFKKGTLVLSPVQGSVMKIKKVKGMKGRSCLRALRCENIDILFIEFGIRRLKRRWRRGA